jgi:hypothetical protein
MHSLGALRRAASPANIWFDLKFENLDRFAGQTSLIAITKRRGRCY